MNFVSFHRPFVSSLVLSEAVLVLVLMLAIEIPLNLQANLRAPEPKSDSPFHFGAPWIVCYIRKWSHRTLRGGGAETRRIREDIGFGELEALTHQVGAGGQAFQQSKSPILLASA